MSRFTRPFAAASAVAALVVLSSATPAAAKGPSHTQITGSGSSWAANALNQWVADVTPKGVPVVFTSIGSTQGRHDFANRTTDFGVSDIAFQGRDPISGERDDSQGRPYAYLP